MKTHSEMIKAETVSGLNAIIDALRTAGKEHVELRINNVPVDTLADEYPNDTILDVYREGGWYEASNSYKRSGRMWVATREFFGPYFDGQYDHETIYVGGSK